MINVQALRAEQCEKAQQIILQDQYNFDEPQWIAGADVGFEVQGTITRAAIAVLHFPSLTLAEYKIARIETQLPYIPGLLSFREYPALLAAWEQLEQRPQLLFVDGHGIAHPRRLGVASHFGLLVDTPTIGVAKKKLCGTYQPVGEEQGASQPLTDKGEQIGWVWRSKIRCNPLFVSTGHRVSMKNALYWVARCTKGYRLPEPTRWADAIASNKSLFQRWNAAESK